MRTRTTLALAAAMLLVAACKKNDMAADSTATSGTPAMAADSTATSGTPAMKADSTATSGTPAMAADTTKKPADTAKTKKP